MQNRSLENTVYVLTAGAFGVFLRWLQLQLAFDDQGLCGPNLFNVVVPLYIVIAAWVLRRRVRQLLGGSLILPADYCEALSFPGKFPTFLRWAIGLLMSAGGALVIRGSDVEKQKMLLRVIGVLAIAAGIGFPLYLGRANRKLKQKLRSLLCLLSLLPIALFGVWLVYDYISNAINSVVWAFLIEVLCVCTLMLSFFRLAGFIFGQVEAKKTLFWLQFGVFMSMVVLADSRSTGMQLIFASAGMMLALSDYILLKKLRDKTEEEAKEAKEDEDTPLPNGGMEKL